MKKIIISFAIVALLYIAVIILPTAMYYMLPCDGLASDVKQMMERRDRVLSQWNPLTGIWVADFSK